MYWGGRKLGYFLCFLFFIIFIFFLFFFIFSHGFLFFRIFSMLFYLLICVSIISMFCYFLLCFLIFPCFLIFSILASAVVGYPVVGYPTLMIEILVYSSRKNPKTNRWFLSWMEMSLGGVRGNPCYSKSWPSKLSGFGNFYSNFRTSMCLPVFNPVDGALWVGDWGENSQKLWSSKFRSVEPKKTRMIPEQKGVKIHISTWKFFWFQFLQVFIVRNEIAVFLTPAMWFSWIFRSGTT